MKDCFEHKWPLQEMPDRDKETESDEIPCSSDPRRKKSDISASHTDLHVAPLTRLRHLYGEQYDREQTESQQCAHALRIPFAAK